jgi:hypothetical protein
MVVLQNPRLSGLPFTHCIALGSSAYAPFSPRSSGSKNKQSM